MKKFKLGIIGVGQMAGSILSGMIKEERVQSFQVGLYDVYPKGYEKFEHQGAIGVSSLKELVAESEIILLGIKPQDFSAIAPGIKASITNDTLIVSMLAGVSGKDIQKALGNVKVLLIMPNTPMMVGQGSTAIGVVPPADKDDLVFVKQMLPGYVAEIPSDKLSEVIPLNGSSPAFVYYFADILAKKGEEFGIDREISLELVAHTLIGSGKMLLESGKTPEELIHMVCSPGGSTLEGMKALTAGGFANALEAAADACVKRAKDLSNWSLIQTEIVLYGSPIYHDIVKLREEAFRIPQGLRFTKEELASDVDAVHFAAFLENELIATGNVISDLDDPSSAVVRQVVVPPHIQGGGYGRYIMEQMQNYAQNKGYKKVRLSGRETVQPFYEKLGYEVQGDYFKIHSVPHIWMTLKL